MDGRERDDSADARGSGPSEGGDDASERGGDDSSDAHERVERLRKRARERWSGPDDDVDGLVSRLHSDDRGERAEAVWSFAELAAEEPDRSRRVPVASELTPLLTDDDRWVRRGASWAVANVADEHPRRAHTVLSAVTESLRDDDPLVRENAVLAVAGVAEEYPHAVEPALDELTSIVADGDGRERRYAAETLRRLVRRLAESGFPETIEATPDLAEILTGAGGIVTVVDDEEGPTARVRGGSDDSSQADAEADRDADEETDADPRGPPDVIPPSPAVEAERDDFVSLEDLGGGPLTTAVKARAPSAGDGSQHVVAVLRTLRPDAGVDAARVERAVRAWAGVDDHDHVAPVLARGTAPRPWFATEFMDGGSLRDHVGSVGFDPAVWYAHCVTTAVCHAHARGVVHGALRPAAVGLSRTLGAWPVPKVGDWAFGDLLAEIRETPVPPAYAAPEHVAPDEFGRPDQATDVYQLGALCYALFAGRPPFAGDAATVARQVVSEDPAPPSAHAERVPEQVDELVGRALTKEKRARFETAEDFLRELELVARKLPLSFEL